MNLSIYLRGGGYLKTSINLIISYEFTISLFGYTQLVFDTFVEKDLNLHQTNLTFKLYSKALHETNS